MHSCGLNRSPPRRVPQDYPRGTNPHHPREGENERKAFNVVNLGQKSGFADNLITPMAFLVLLFVSDDGFDVGFAGNPVNVTSGDVFHWQRILSLLFIQVPQHAEADRIVVDVLHWYV